MIFLKLITCTITQNNILKKNYLKQNKNLSSIIGDLFKNFHTSTHKFKGFVS